MVCVEVRFYLPVTWTGVEFPRVNISSELKKRPGILAEVSDVEHGLRIRQIRKINGEARVDAVT